MLVDRIRRAYEVIAKVERVAAAFPDDLSVRANLTSLKYDVEQLERDWAEQAQQHQVEICRYRMIPSLSQYNIKSVTKSLLDFQELFSQVYDAVRNGAKNKPGWLKT